MNHYSRQNPSPRYQELAKMYSALHQEGEKFSNLPAEDTFPGISLPPQAPRIKRLIDITNSRTILDYGSGKGKQYQASPIHIPDVGEVQSMREYWGVDTIRCYDPNYVAYRELPKEKFDGVVCSDVLEHCPEEDLPWILDEIFGYANAFVFANAACYPAQKRLPNGENAHCTIQPPEWWQSLLEATAAKHPHVKYEFHVEHLVGGFRNGRRVDDVLTNIPD